MASDLRDRLHDLADRTPPAAAPPDLWSRGVRRRRGSQATTSVLVAALVLILGVGGWTWQASRQDLAPVSPHGSVHLPDRIYEPSPWLGGFDGPPGQLVALLQAQRKTLLHTTGGLVGVTASTGQYGFLDLPDAVDRAVLSPDGRRIAYWGSGPTSADPHTVADGKAIGSLVIYDTATGHLVRQQVATAHGIEPAELIWTGDESLYYDFSQQRGGDDDSRELQSESDQETAGTWDAQTQVFGPLPVRRHISYSSAASAPGAPLVLDGDAEGSYWVQPAPLAKGFHPFRWDSSSATAPGIALAADQTMLAGLSNGAEGADRSPSSIAAGRLPQPVGSRLPVVTVPLVPHSGQAFAVLAWLDPQHVAALRRNPLDGAPQISMRVDSIDIRSGHSRTLMDHLATNYPSLQLATDLLSAPPAHATPPPKPWDLRWTLGGIVFGLLTIAFVVWGMRRGRRP
jgi:hypothetical protein